LGGRGSELLVQTAGWKGIGDWVVVEGREGKMDIAVDIMI
jgi:hypothetical protein